VGPHPGVGGFAESNGLLERLALLFVVEKAVFPRRWVRKRSLVYVNKRLSTSAHRQVQCNSPDISVVKVWTDDTQILILSDMTKCHRTCQYNLRSTKYRPLSKIIMAGDFNRHRPA